jgi:hypothetical protein
MDANQPSRLAALGLLTAACLSCTQGDRSAERNPPNNSVHIEVGSTSFCVEREFIDQRYFRAGGVGGALVGPNLGRAYIFVPPDALTAPGMRAPQAAGTGKDDLNRNIQLMLFPKGKGTRSDVAASIRQYYEPESSEDHGFRSHKRTSDCISKGWVPNVPDPDCLTATLKYGHPESPDVVLHCLRAVCWVDTRLPQDGVWVDYAFPQSSLRDWPVIHRGLQRLVHEWAADTSCRGRDD